MEQPLAKVEELSEEKVTRIDFFGRPVILYRNGDRIFVAVDVCTHLGGPLELEDGTLVCQWHGSSFARDSGKALKPPAPRDSHLIRLPTRVRDGIVYYVTRED